MEKPSGVAGALLRSDAALQAELEAADIYETSTQGRKCVVVDEERYWVVEGDTLLDRDALALYALAQQRAASFLSVADAAGFGLAAFASPLNSALVGITQNGKIVRWQPGLTLTYRLARNTFTSQDRYEGARAAMGRATRDWEATCGIRFAYQPELDDLPGIGPGSAVFVVREIDSGGTFIASAFFPNDPPMRRRVLIDPSFFSNAHGFDSVGVLRHELGHVLGFRHEHIRSGAPPVCPGEALADTVELTQYDPQSVMHYFCGQVGSRDLRITATDRAGAQQVYGPPLDSLQLVA